MNQKKSDASSALLLGLNSGFGNAISSSLAMDPLPSLSRAFYLAQQMERQKEVSSMYTGPWNHEVIAFVAKKQLSNAKNSYKKDWKKDKLDTVCDFFKKQGHTRDTCFQLKDFPEWFTKKHGVPYKLAAHVSADRAASEADDPFEYTAASPSYSQSVSTNMKLQILSWCKLSCKKWWEPWKVCKQIVGEYSSNSVSYSHILIVQVYRISFKYYSSKSDSDCWFRSYSLQIIYPLFDNKLSVHIRTLAKKVEIGLPSRTRVRVGFQFMLCSILLVHRHH